MFAQLAPTVRCAFSYHWLFICIQLVWLVADWILWQNGWMDWDAAWQKFYKTANFCLKNFLAPGSAGPYRSQALRLQPHQPHGWSGHGDNPTKLTFVRLSSKFRGLGPDLGQLRKHLFFYAGSNWNWKYIIDCMHTTKVICDQRSVEIDGSVYSDDK